MLGLCYSHEVLITYLQFYKMICVYEIVLVHFVEYI